MNIIQYKDNDLLNKPQKDNAPVYALEDKPTALTKQELMAKFPKVFGEGVGQLDGIYKIRIDETVQSVQHAPRRIAVALRPKLNEALDDLVTQDIIAPVTIKPTEWISSIVAVPKNNGKLMRTRREH